jgi:BirA family biotin operon repressor/biotin-[acetyl-CoA-carboxylase] ligase
MDREIILDNNAGELQAGIYRGISESGALMLQVGDVIRCYAAGTVRFPQDKAKRTI